MRLLQKNITLALFALASVFIMPQKAHAQEVSFQVFYDDLSPYGTWVNSPEYGYVWVPSASQGFVPYETGGHWVYTEYGWTWVSDYAWGWAPFHYGRWHTDPVYGAMWVPGNEWGPAWVTWRHADGYYGWAPMEPGISVGVYVGSGYNIPADRWCFVHEGDFGRTDIRNHYVSRTENNTIISHSTPVSNTVVDHNSNQTYVAGPPSNDVQRATGKPVNTVAVHDAGKPAQSQSGNNLEIYRPKVQNNTAVAGQKPAPSHATEMKDLKPAAQRPATQPAAKPATAKPVQAKPAPANVANKSAMQNKGTTAPVRQAPQQRTPVQSQPNKQAPVQRPANTAPAQNRQQLAPVQRTAPQQRPAAQQTIRQAAPQQQRPAQQPIRQAPQQQPIRQAPAQQPMRQAPAQQPMHQSAPQQQPHMEQPMRQAAPAPQPHMEAPQQSAPQPMRAEPQHGPGPK